MLIKIHVWKWETAVIKNSSRVLVCQCPRRVIRGVNAVTQTFTIRPAAAKAFHITLCLRLACFPSAVIAFSPRFVQWNAWIWVIVFLLDFSNAVVEVAAEVFDAALTLRRAVLFGVAAQSVEDLLQARVWGIAGHCLEGTAFQRGVEAVAAVRPLLKLRVIVSEVRVLQIGGIAVLWVVSVPKLGWAVSATVFVLLRSYWSAFEESVVFGVRRGFAVLGRVPLPRSLKSMFLFPPLKLSNESWIGIDLRGWCITLLRFLCTARNASW